ncbi:multiheme c-type cytochrome [Bythopirellula goksoeyrii]|nr:multiheme c-type cytochrome [Bythopirellula goksoeyrii]
MAEHFRKRHPFLGLSVLVLAVVIGIAFSSGIRSAEHGKFPDRAAEIADAIKKNDRIFVDWPKPEFTLVFSGDTDGYLEPCGCAGLDNQKGGMKRRHTFLKQLAADGWNPVALDMGGEVRRTGSQAEMKYRYALRSLIDMGYAVVTFGLKDLQLSSEAILFVLANLDPDNNPLVSANVDLFGMAQPFKIVDAGGKKIGVTAVLGAKARTLLEGNEEIAILDPVESLRDVIPQLEAQNCDLNVLLVHGEPDEATELARQFPVFDLVGTTGGAETPPPRSRPIEGANSYLIETGQKGQYVIALGVYDDPEYPLRYQRVPLDHRFEDSPAMQELLVEYQKELETTTLAGLGLTGIRHPEDSFAGSAACADCHTEATEVFLNTPHAHATETLVNLDPPRQFDPECLSCHVTGWNPQEYFPYESGFVGLKQTPLMTGNGCENCHGPAAAHVAAESGEETLSDEEIESLRAALRMKIVENEGNISGQTPPQVVGAVVNKCLECHDLDNSPDFDFQEYWPQVEHYGKE